ncbi:hypothetical protein BDV06DRAFT_186089 [Aspergillus oleicola]
MLMRSVRMVLHCIVQQIEGTIKLCGAFSNMEPILSSQHITVGLPYTMQLSWDILVSYSHCSRVAG